MDANYPTDLTDEQWQAISRLVPPAKPGGQPRSVDMRQVLNGLFYLGRTGAPGGCCRRSIRRRIRCITISRRFARTAPGSAFTT